MSSAERKTGPGAPPAVNGKPAATAPAKPDVYRSPMAVFFWWVWVLFAAANLIDLAVQGRDHFGALVASILLLITAVAYVSAFRPRVVSDAEAITLRNPLRETRVLWTTVESVTLGDSLLVQCVWPDSSGQHRKVFYGWAVHSSRRSRARAEARTSRQRRRQPEESPLAAKLPPEARAAMNKTDAEQISLALEARLAKAKKRGGATAAPVSAWHWPSAALLALAALLLVGVAVLA